MKILETGKHNLSSNSFAFFLAFIASSMAYTSSTLAQTSSSVYKSFETQQGAYQTRQLIYNQNKVIRTHVSNNTSETASVSGNDLSYPGKRPLPKIYRNGKAINYGAYRGRGPDYGEVPTESEILQDLKLFNDNGFKLIRLFGADETILRLASMHYPSLKFQLGVFLFPAFTASGCVGQPFPVNNDSINTLISLANTYDNVVTVSVGNETQLFGGMEIPCMEQYITTVRNAIEQPITTDQIENFFISDFGGAAEPLLKLIDFVSYHQYPFFIVSGGEPWKFDGSEPGVPYVPAGPKRAKAMMESLVGVMKSSYIDVTERVYTDASGAVVKIGDTHPIVIGETGWKSHRTYAPYNLEFDKYTSNPVNQKWYFDLLKKWLKASKDPKPVNIIAFAGMDEYWKNDIGIDFAGSTGNGDDGWGFWNVVRAPKYVLCDKEGIQDCNENVYSGAGYFGAVQETSPNVTVSANKRWNGYLRGANFEFGFPFPVGLFPALFTAPEPGDGELVIAQSTFDNPASYPLVSSLYVQNPDIDGDIVTFSGTCLSNTLTSDYTVEAVIILFDTTTGGFEYSGIKVLPLTDACNNSTFSVSIDRTPGGPDAFRPNNVVQYGFNITGPQTFPGVDVGRVIIKIENDDFPENEPLDDDSSS